MRVLYNQDLQNLHDELLKMGSAIEKSLDLTIEALNTNNEDLMHEIIERDDIIDNFEIEIEKRCLTLISMQNPVAGDLRAIASILKIITDLERIADQSSDIAYYLLKITKNGYDGVKFDVAHIVEMAKYVKKMLARTIECYVSLNKEEAVKICKDDDIVDKLFVSIGNEITEHMTNYPEFIKNGICYLYIIKYCERMADHATNVCEWLAYRVSGEHLLYN